MLVNRGPGAVATVESWPAAASPAALSSEDAAVEERLARMTVHEKVGQTIQAEASAIRPEELTQWPVGSILIGGDGGPGKDDRAPLHEWVALTQRFQAASEIPLLIGIDAVHGHNNIVGAAIYPHNIGLGAARDPELVRRIQEATAEEVAATGINWNFAPTVAVPRDLRWGRTYEGWSSDPAIVEAYAGAAVRGLQGDVVAGQPLAAGRVAATAKHFVGDGATRDGVDQGDARIPEAEMSGVHARGYVSAIDAGALTVMASFSSWNGQKMHGNASLLTDVLKGRMGFRGLVVGDWNGHEQLRGCTAGDCPDALNAGVDLLMVPYAWKDLYQSTLRHVESGEIPMERLDDAVRRILRVKAKLGILDGERPAVDLSRVGAPEHRQLAREAAQRSVVLLKNDGALPISWLSRVLVTGPAADDIGAACGGWTITWQGNGTTNADFPNGQSIAAALEEIVVGAEGEVERSPDGSYTVKPDVAVVVFGEPPYAEGKGDLKDLAWTDDEALRILRKLKGDGVKTVAVFLSGRPRGIDRELAVADAFVAAFLPGSEGGGVADVLVGDSDGAPVVDFTGKLPYAWPGEPGFELGFGLSYR